MLRIVEPAPCGSEPAEINVPKHLPAIRPELMNDLVDQPGWLYICMDVKNPGECKLGSSTRPLYDRVTETGNPDYMIVKAYQVPPEESLKLEKHLRREVGKVASRKVHILTGRQSEWFTCTPKEAAQAIEHDLAKCLRLQDEDGVADLSAITFKPVLDDGNKLKLALRVQEQSHFDNIIHAIEEC